MTNIFVRSVAGVSLLGICAFVCPAGALSATPDGKLNVLFIAVDDLRPQLGCYGHTEMVTPSLDRLAREGRVFNHHYVQAPTCGASRCSMLTGHYPSAPAAYENEAFATLAREPDKAIVSLPALFQQNGYNTVSIGKITHAPDGRRDDGETELPFGWDETDLPLGVWKDAWSAFFAYAGGGTRVVGKSAVTERADVDDRGYPDGLIADAAIAKLKALKDEAFFLAVGFFKPHLPFNAPAKYWDLYEPALLPAVPNSEPPLNVDPTISLHKSGEMLGRYTGFSDARRGVSPAEARRLRHAYYACVSYVDAQIGRVLAELDRLGLSESTVVVVWGDHGWHLGEHGIWGKHTLHEVALRSPLIVRTPKMASPGIETGAFVESVDIFPTLAEVCGLKPPPGFAGVSFVRQLREPSAPGTPAVYGFWSRGQAHTVRTERYRLIHWAVPKVKNRPPVEQIELYDHQNDPNETTNIAGNEPDVVAELQRQLRASVPLLDDGS